MGDRLSPLLQLYEAKWDKAARDALPAEDFAGPNKSYPIKDCNDVKDAWDLAGKADNPGAVRSKIRSIAKRKGLTKCLPDTATESKESASNFATHLNVEVIEAGDGSAKKPVVMLIAAGTSNGVHGRIHYSKQMLMREAGKFEHIPVFDNHQSPKEEADKPYRSIREHLGYIDNVRYDGTPRGAAPEGGLIGDLDVIEGNEWFGTRLNRRPDTVKFSIRASGVANGTLPSDDSVPVLESFRQTKSCDAVIKAGAGGQVISVAEAAAEEMDMLLRDLTIDQIRQHPQWSQIEQMVRESYVSRDYGDDDKDLLRWKNKMATARMNGDVDAHDKLLSEMPAYHRHDREECHMCNPKTRAGTLPPGTPTAGAGAQVTEAAGENEEIDMKPEEIAAIVKTSVEEAVKPIRETVDRMERERNTASIRGRLEAMLRESGLPSGHQKVVLEDLVEAAAEGTLPTDDTKLKAVFDRKVARQKTVAFDPNRNPGATGQGDADAARQVREAQGGAANAASETEELLAIKLGNPNIPPPANRGSEEAANGQQQPTQTRAIMETAGTPRRRRDALDEAWNDPTPNVGLEA